MPPECVEALQPAAANATAAGNSTADSDFAAADGAPLTPPTDLPETVGDLTLAEQRALENNGAAADSCLRLLAALLAAAACIGL